MIQNPHNYLSINHILADVLVALHDQDTRRLTPGFYRNQTKACLDELGFDTFFNDYYEDIDIPPDLIIDIPQGAYNIKTLHIYKGTPENIEYQENVYWKRNFYTSETGYTANKHHQNTTDPFFRATLRNNARYFFNVHRGQIMLSETCKYFDYLRITSAGIPSMTIDDVQMIPPEVRKAVTLWVIEKCASYLKLQDNNYRVIQLDAAAQLDEYGLNGAWHQAKSRLRKLDRKQMADVLIYNAKMNY